MYPEWRVRHKGSFLAPYRRAGGPAGAVRVRAGLAPRRRGRLLAGRGGGAARLPARRRVRRRGGRRGPRRAGAPGGRGRDSGDPPPGPGRVPAVVELEGREARRVRLP